jgi:penicillin amidase
MGFYRHSNPYNHAVGASLRLVIDLGDWENSGFVLPSGQSGHPSSVHYRDQTELWRRGKLISISSPLEPQAAKSCLTLLPG